MIEAHVVDAVLSKTFKSGWLYNIINISNGFVAVAFLFCAGAGFWIATIRKADDYRKFAPPFWNYLRRLGLILLVAYWLHLPTMTFYGMWKLSWDSWVSFFQFDILQTIVYSSFIALILVLMIKNLNLLKSAFGLIAFVVVVSAPIVLKIDPHMFNNPFLASWFTKYPISKFPLFPWSAYFFAGGFFTAIFLQTENKKKLLAFLLVTCTILLIVIYFTREYTNFFTEYKDWWFVSPIYVLFRLSGVVAAFALLYLIENGYKEKTIGKVLQFCGQESLYFYVVHLLLVYGSVANFGMKYYVGTRLDPFATILLIIGIWIMMFYTAQAWSQIKATNMKTARLVMASILGFFFLVFLLNPL